MKLTASNGQNFELDQTEMSVGRTTGNTIQLDDSQVSSKHAVITHAGGGYILKDVGSTNGTFVNGERLEVQAPYTLQPGDEIRMGSLTLTVIGEAPGRQGTEPGTEIMGATISADIASSPAPTPPPAPMPPTPPPSPTADAPAFCVNCGAKLEDGALFCTSCGTKQPEPPPAAVVSASGSTPEPYAAPARPAGTSSGDKNKETLVLIAEIVGGYFGVLGIGHFISGRVGWGIGALLGWWLILVPTLAAVVATGGLCALVGIPLYFGIPIASGIMARNYVRENG